MSYIENKLLKIPSETFANYIKRIRELRGYSQRKLSTITSLSNTTISRIEKGGEHGIENPDIYTVVKLAEGLKIDKEQMLIAAGYLDQKENTQTDDIKQIIIDSIQKLGWANSIEDINIETINFVAFTLKNYGIKNKQIP